MSTITENKTLLKGGEWLIRESIAADTYTS